MAVDGTTLGQAGAGAGAGAAAGSLFGPVGTAIGAAGGFLLPIVGQLIGDLFASGDRDKARQLYDQMLQQYGPEALKVPEIAVLTPHFGPSAMEQVRPDAGAIAAQQSTLAALQRIAQGQGGDLEFRAARAAGESEANRQAGAQQASIQQQLQERGLGGSGLDFALRQRAGQAAGEAASQRGFDAALAGKERALSALASGGALAGQIRGQSFGEGSARAQAADLIARRNEEGRVGALQQDFANRMGLAGARAGAYGQAAGFYGGQGAQTAQQWGNMGQGAGMAAAGLGQRLNEDERRRREEERRAGGY